MSRYGSGVRHGGHRRGHHQSRHGQHLDGPSVSPLGEHCLLGAICHVTGEGLLFRPGTEQIFRDVTPAPCLRLIEEQGAAKKKHVGQTRDCRVIENVCNALSWIDGVTAIVPVDQSVTLISRERDITRSVIL